MPRNGSGQYNPLTNTWNPPVTGVLATGADFQAQLNDISAAITQSVSKDGQTPMTANLPMGNNSIVGIASGTETSPSISANGDTNTGLYFPAADTVGVAVGGVQALLIDSAGIEVPAGTAAAPSLTTTGDTNTGLYFPAADTVGVAVGGVQVAQISPNGFAVNGNNISAVNSLGFRNRIINGDMRIDQRNAGAIFTPVTATLQYALDRWGFNRDTAGATVTVQQSSIAPAGFTNSFLLTVSTGANAGASDQNVFQQPIEGFNAADLGWGTASAQTVTISFWVRSSVTGTYGLSLSNSAGNRAYLATYTINAANTFEFKTITIPGDTTGTWLTNNGIGIRVRWDFGSGSSRQGTAGSWGSTLFNTTSAQANVIGTTGATFYITGAQLEAGSVATPFERRDYGRELIMCQRYYMKLPNDAVSGGDAANTNRKYFPVTMRASPTMTGTVTTGSGASIVAIENYGWAQSGLNSVTSTITGITASAEL